MIIRYEYLIILLFLYLLMRLKVLLIWYKNNRPHKKPRGYIYWFSDIGQIVPSVKIGRTNEPARRLAAHRTSAPLGIFVWLVLPVRDDRTAETFFHSRYFRINREWFWLSPGLLVDLFVFHIIKRIVK